MNWKELYEKVIKTICEKKIDEFDDIYEPIPPETLLNGVMYLDESSPEDSLIRFRLDENIAKEKEYKDFCEFVFDKIGEDINDYLGERKFSNFKSSFDDINNKRIGK